MPEAEIVTLKIYDVSGRILKLQVIEAAKGFNSVEIEKGYIQATGVLYYQLETASEITTKKMVLTN